MIDIGMPTLIETKTLEDCAVLCNNLGLSFIELNMNLPQYQLQQMDVVHLSQVAQQYGLYYTLHLDENLNPCDYNPKVANAYSDTVLDAISFAKQLQIPIINMHLANGIYITLPNKTVYLYDAYLSDFLFRLKEFRAKCEEAIGDAPLKICIENTDGWVMEFQRKALELLLESPVFQLTLDIGHNHTSGNIDEPWMLAYGQRLLHMHIHDAKGKRNHMVLGSGELELLRYFELAKQNHCRMVVETKTIDALKESVAYLRQAWSNV